MKKQPAPKEPIVAQSPAAEPRTNPWERGFEPLVMLDAKSASTEDIVEAVMAAVTAHKKASGLK